MMGEIKPPPKFPWTVEFDLRPGVSKPPSNVLGILPYPKRFSQDSIAKAKPPKTRTTTSLLLGVPHSHGCLLDDASRLERSKRLDAGIQ